jgi:hypothetical protein
METFDLDALLQDLESEEASNPDSVIMDAPPWLTEALVLVCVRPN